MQDQDYFYPIKITSRSVIKKRSRRILCLVIGTGFGISCTLFALPNITTPAWIYAQKAPVKAKGLPVTEAINVVAFAPMPKAPSQIPPKIQPVAESSKNTYPLALNLKVEDGDTIKSILSNVGVSHDDAQHVIDAINAEYDPKKLEIGQNISILLDEDPSETGKPIVSNMKFSIAPTALLEITRSKIAADSGFKVKKSNVEVEYKLARAGGPIDSSIYDTGVSSGMPIAILNDVINAYSYDVDFQREIQPGDKMDVLFERNQTKDGIMAGHGNVLFAELSLSGKSLKIFRYVDKFGVADYYNEKGESVRKALLRTPVNGARITSGYGMRNHPILGYSRMHRGVDFGAPTGTPIYAAGDGVVEFVGRKGGYGNYLRIRHNNKYESAYAHISRFAAGIEAGHKVKQGQVIAYVGATGMATGPHLHFEVLVNNEQVDPASVKFKNGNVLTGREMASFRRNMEHILAQLISTPRKTDLAMADINN